MARKKISDEISFIKKALDDKKLVIGTDRNVKELKRGNLSSIFIAANCPENIKVDLEHYCKLQKIELGELSATNEELGVLCKKPFSISIVGILKK